MGLWRIILVTVLVLTLSLCSIEGHNILLVFTIPGKSLSILGEAVVSLLLKEGHEVTYVTPFPMKDKPKKNFREVDVSFLRDMITGNDLFNLTYLLETKEIINDRYAMMQFGYTVAQKTLDSENFQELLNDDQHKFDLVMADLFDSEIFAGLATYYDCPLIWAYSIGVDWSAIKLIHEPSNPAYSADYLSFNVPPLNFIQRVEELWNQIYSTYLKRFKLRPIEHADYERIYGPLMAKKGKSLPPLDVVYHSGALMVANLHHAIENLPPLPQSFKMVGGFHIDEPKPLPADLKAIMDNAKHGIIYFSLGSVWQSQTMPKVLIDGLLKMFGELKQTVLWKFEADLPNVPKNVHSLKWAPQQSILAHPNCLMFVTHGGLLSSTEAIHFGVPIIGVPVYFDQFININKAVLRGYALRADLAYDLPITLKKAIDTMLSHPRITAKAKELTMIYHDRPASPRHELVFWVQHVLKTKGALHLRSPALMMPWYQKTYIDLAALLVAGAVVLYVVVRKILLKSDKPKMKKN